MKTTAVAVVLCAFVVSRALCGEQSPGDFFVGGGWSVALHPSDWASGYTLAAGFLTSVTPFAKVGASFEFGQFLVGQFPVSQSPAILPRVDKASPPVTSRLSFYGGRADVFSIGPAAKVVFVEDTRKITPYFVASARYFRLRTTRAVLPNGQYSPIPSIVGGDPESAFAIQLGLGIDLPLNQNAGLFFQADFVNAFTGPPATQYLPLKAGMKFSP